MYVYLDTSQLSQISDLAFSSSGIEGIFPDEFFRQWNSTNSELCLSLQHLKEISHLHKQSRENRLNSLQNLNNLRYSPLGWSSIIQNEAIIQILNLISSKNSDLISLFKEDIWKKTNSRFLLDYIENNLTLIRKSRGIYEVASEIEELFKSVRQMVGNHWKKRFRDLKSTHSDNLEELKRISEQLQSAYETERISNVFTEKIFRTVQETGSLFSSLVKLLDIEEHSDIEKRYLSDASSLSVYYKLIREAIPYIARITELSENEVSQRITKCNPSSCPGFSLRMALFRALHSSDKKFKPSDWGDTDHIVYAPYVDISFVDKRTYTFLNQETRQQPFRLDDSLISNIQRIVPLKELIQHISI